MVAADIKSVRLRIKSIQNTIQIMKAMELVASSRLRRAKEKVETSASYLSALRRTLISIAAENTDYTSVYARKNQSHRHYYVLIVGDHGMAGGYNANLFRAFGMENREKEFAVLPLGKKARDYVVQKRLECLESGKIMVVSIHISDCYAVARRPCALFRTGEFGHISLFYTDFVFLTKQGPGSSGLLSLVDFKNEDCAICDKKGEEKKGVQNLTLHGSSAEEVYDAIVLEYPAGLLYSTVASSLASGYTTRRTATETATDSAGEMIDKLSLHYNRVRQANITQETAEIVSGTGGSNG